MKQQLPPSWRTLPPGHASVRVMARGWESAPGTLRWGWSGSGALVSFYGTACGVHLRAPGGRFRVRVDDQEMTPLDLTGSDREFHELALDLEPGAHRVEIRQMTEAQHATATFRGFAVLGEPAALPPPSDRRIEFYGDSITCGYGILAGSELEGFEIATQDEGLGFAALAADSLGAERRCVCWSGKGVVQNHGLDPREPTLPRLHRRILPDDGEHLWDFSRWIPQAVVVHLGTNDFSAIAPDRELFVEAYCGFVLDLHAAYPEARFVLLDGPMLNDLHPPGIQALSTLRDHLRTVVQRLERRGVVASHLSLTPQGPLGYGADWHPNTAQARLNGQELASHLARLMGWTSTA